MATPQNAYQLFSLDTRATLGHLPYGGCPNGEFLSLARPKGFALRACSFATQTVAFYVSRVSAKANRREIDYRGSNPFPLFVKKRNPPNGEFLSLARPKGFEPPLSRIGICCVIQLRHGRIICHIIIFNSRLFKSKNQY